MKITSVNVSKKYVNFKIDDEQRFRIRYEIFVKNMLVKGDEISEQKLNHILRENFLFESKEKAIFILSRRLHSKYELKQKLIKRGYESDVIDEVISYLEEKNYLDDSLFTAKFIESRRRVKGDGLNKIKNSLLSKGVSKSIIEDELSKINDDDLDFENALKFGKRKLASIKDKSDKYKVRGKIERHLLNKGFSFDIIKRVLSEIEIR